LKRVIKYTLIIIIILLTIFVAQNYPVSSEAKSFARLADTANIRRNILIEYILKITGLMKMAIKTSLHLLAQKKVKELLLALIMMFAESKMGLMIMQVALLVF